MAEAIPHADSQLHHVGVDASLWRTVYCQFGPSERPRAAREDCNEWVDKDGVNRGDCDIGERADLSFRGSVLAVWDVSEWEMVVGVGVRCGLV